MPIKLKEDGVKYHLRITLIYSSLVHPVPRYQGSRYNHTNLSFGINDKHPIVNWYNNGLTADMQKLQQCPQIQVSINTDDQGVFSTYLENEYAYLALALEKCKDENGERIYNRTMILQWLNNIRKIGNSQSFLQHRTDEED